MFGSFSRWSYEWTQFNQQEKHIQLQLFSCTVQVAIALFQLWMYKNHRKFLILFSGDCGKSLVEWVRYLIGRDMRFPHIKVIIPTAPSQPYTMLNGQVLFKSLYWLIFEKKNIADVMFHTRDDYFDRSVVWGTNSDSIFGQISYFEFLKDENFGNIPNILKILKMVFIVEFQCVVWSTGALETGQGMPIIIGRSIWVDKRNHSIRE